MPSLRFDTLTFGFPHAEPIVNRLDLHLDTGWTGLVGENGVGKTTLLRLIAGELTPDVGTVRRDPPDAVIVICRQTAETADADIHALAERSDGLAHSLRGRLQLVPAMLTRWTTLSPGERKRWQIGAALARRPDLLLLDEPTNHLDQPARTLLFDALRHFSGIGVVVSHDRALLDLLTTRTLWLHRGTLRSFPATYSDARRLRDEELRSTLAARDETRRQADRLARRYAEARESARSRRPPKREQRKNPHDARSMSITNGRAWAEDRLGATASGLHTRVDQTRADIADLPLEAMELGRSVFLGYEPTPRPVLIGLDRVAIRRGGRVLLRDVHLQIRRNDRLRIAGPNGSGKTSLLTELLAGSTLPPHRVLYLPQDTATTTGQEMLAHLRSCDSALRGRILSVVAALGSDPARLLATDAPSPGEVRKLQLAHGLGTHAWLLVLDEPTNHLDLPVIERLEKALAAFPGAIALVTHDDAFATAITHRSVSIVDSSLRSTVTP